MNQPMDFEIPATVRDLASKSVDQAREAYNRFLEAARQAHDRSSPSQRVCRITPGPRTAKSSCKYPGSVQTLPSGCRRPELTFRLLLATLIRGVRRNAIFFADMFPTMV